MEVKLTPISIALNRIVFRIFVVKVIVDRDLLQVFIGDLYFFKIL